MQGHGNYYQADGSLYCGVFEEGKLLSSSPHYYLSGDSHLSRENRKRVNVRTYENFSVETQDARELEAPENRKESIHLQNHEAVTEENNIVPPVPIYGEQEYMPNNLLISRDDSRSLTVQSEFY